MLKRALGRILDILASLNLAIFILISLVLVIILQLLSGRLAGLMESLPWLETLTSGDFYSSRGFSAMLLAFCINLLACSLKRIPWTLSLLRSWSRELRDDVRDTLPFTVQIETDQPAEAACEKACAAVQACFKKPLTVRQEPGLARFFAEKSRYSHLGFYFAHLSILLVVLGVVLSSMAGLRFTFVMSKGELLDPLVIKDSRGELKPLPFALQCDDHGVEYHKGTQRVSKHFSTLTILENGRKIKTDSLDFAKSMTHRGYEIYQVRFKGNLKYATLEVTDKNGETREVKLKSGGWFTLPELDTYFWGTRMTRDYVRLKCTLAPESVRVFRNRSEEIDHPALKGYQFRLKEMKTRVGTKLKLVRDPGKMIIWFAMLGMLAGFAVVFFLPHQLVWVSVDSRNGRSVITLAGTSTKDLAAFEENVFNRIRESL